MREDEAKQKTKFFGLSRNVLAMGVVSFLNDLSSDMIFPFIPFFLTSVLGAPVVFVGLVEGIADATASIVKIASGWLSDRMRVRKRFVVFGYSFSALAKPLLALAATPWHVLGVRLLDRVGKGVRDAPRDALISFSASKDQIGRAFGFHRGADTLGAALGPVLAFLLLPFIDNDIRTLFFLSFIASFCAVIILIVFVREVRDGRESPVSQAEQAAVPSSDARTHLTFKGFRVSFLIFLAAATILALGRSSEAFLILRAQGIGVALTLLPIIYFVYSITFAVCSTPAGILSDKIGHRNTFMIGILVFSGVYVLFARVSSPAAIWGLFALYGVFSALTEGVGRAIVADLVEEKMRAVAYGIYNACTGIALLPASVIFGLLWEYAGPSASFYYGAALGMIALVIFSVLRIRFHTRPAVTR